MLLSERGEVSLRRFSSPGEEVIASGTFSPASRHVLVWPSRTSPVAYLPDNGDATLLLKQKHIDYAKLKLEEKNWENGMKLSVMWQHSKLDPRDSAEKHYTLIANSFRTGLLTPLTAFLSPESELQRKLLLRKQSQVRASMRPLNVGEEYEMNEPPLWVMALLTSAVLLWRALLKRGSETDQSNARVISMRQYTRYIVNMEQDI